MRAGIVEVWVDIGLWASYMLQTEAASLKFLPKGAESVVVRLSVDVRRMVATSEDT